MDETVVELPITDRAWAWYQANQKQLLWGTIVVVGVALGIGFFSYQKAASERSASAALSAVEGQRLFTPNRVEPAETYIKIANDHSGTKAAARALLMAGGAYFAQGNFTEAQAQFQKFLTQYADDPHRAQALLGVASCLDAQGKADEAAVAYKNVVDRHAGESVVPSAKFAMARIYESQNKLEQAQKLYEEIMREAPGGSMGNEAGLRADELRAKLPPPAAPVSVTPSASTVVVPGTPAVTPAGTTN